MQTKITQNELPQIPEDECTAGKIKANHLRKKEAKNDVI